MTVTAGTATRHARTEDLDELVGLIHWHIGVWHDLGYENPPAPDCKTIPPPGQRSASAIKAGHEAVEDIDRLVARLHQVRAQLVGELRQDEDIRAARVDTMLASRPDQRAAALGARMSRQAAAQITEAGQ